MKLQLIIVSPGLLTYIAPPELVRAVLLKKIQFSTVPKLLINIAPPSWAELFVKLQSDIVPLLVDTAPPLKPIELLIKRQLNTIPELMWRAPPLPNVAVLLVKLQFKTLPSWEIDTAPGAILSVLLARLPAILQFSTIPS